MDSAIYFSVTGASIAGRLGGNDDSSVVDGIVVSIPKASPERGNPNIGPIGRLCPIVLDRRVLSDDGITNLLGQRSNVVRMDPVEISLHWQPSFSVAWVETK